MPESGGASAPESIFGMILEHVVLPVIAGRETEFLAAFAQAQPIIGSIYDPFPEVAHFEIA